MERDPSIASAEATTGFSIMERIRNSRAGMFVTTAVASLSLSSAVGVGEMAFNTEPVSANDTPNPALEQQCIQAGLTAPQILKDKLSRPPVIINGIVMTYPGAARPSSEHGEADQEIFGQLDYPPMPTDCYSQYLRIGTDQIQMKKQGRWVNIQPRYFLSHLVYEGDQEQELGLDFIWPHEWPTWALDRCIPNMGYQKVQAKLTETVRSNHEIVGQNETTVPVTVIGRCRE